MKNLLILLLFSEIAGILLADCQWVAGTFWWLLSGAAALAAFLFRASWQRATLSCVIVLCAGASSLSSQWEASSWPYPDTPTVEKIIEGRIARVTEGQGWRRLILEEVVDGFGVGIAPPRRVELRWDHGQSEQWVISNARVGDRIRAQVRLRPLHSMANPGSGMRERQTGRQGIAASARLVSPGLAVQLFEKPTWRSRVRTWRARLRHDLLSLGPGSGLVVALVLGDRSGLSSEERAAFARLGLSHLLAVSGLHLGMVASAAFLLFRFTLSRIPGFPERRDVRPLAAWMALAVAVGYAALAGWGLPVRRSLILLLALVIGLGLGRRGGRFHPLAAAGLFLLWREPQLLFDPGAQMSFSVSAALLWMSSPVATADGWLHETSPALRSAARALHGCFRVSLVALAASAPITAQAFGSVAPMAALWNLIAVPLTGFLLLPGALFLSAGVVGLESFGSPEILAPHSAWVSWISVGVEVLWGSVLEGVLALAPASLVLAAQPQLAWPWMFATLGLALLTARLKRSLWKAICAGVSCAVLSFAPVAAVSPQPPRIVFLDVGQGDAIVIQGRESAVLIDAGNSFSTGGSLGEVVVLPALRAMKVSHLDLLIATHADRDHQGGLAAVLRGVSVGALWLPYGGVKDPAFGSLIKTALEEKVPVIERGTDAPAETVGDVWIEPLWPPRQASSHT
ncbi:MAG: ComEC/Rec2 family competence protein, partial [Deltaproteobacteria bacterium]|nr:ComEC/Rec2 family competence protein [Deltaproteobacteria bacterium]